MKVGDLIKISTAWGKYFAYDLPVSGGCVEISGMIGIYLGQSQYLHEAGLETGRVLLSNGWLCNIFEPHVRIEVISASTCKTKRDIV
jgi:hypothetical protein